MALTTAQAKVHLARQTFTKLLPQPTADQRLQRQIEDTLIKISDLPESSEKVMIDLSNADTDDVPGFYEIQWNQLELFMKLERLVEWLSPEKKRTLIAGLHPAMSVEERRALKLVLERGLRGNMVPRPLNVRKVVRVKAEERVAAPAAPVYGPSSLAENAGLVFAELTVEEEATRRQQLGLAKRGGGDAANEIMSDGPRRTSEESKSHRLFSQATKKTPSQTEEAPTSQEKAAASSARLREGLQKVKKVGSAVRAFTDASPRGVVVRPRADSSRSSEETVRASVSSPRPSVQVQRSGTAASSHVQPLAHPDQVTQALKHQISMPATRVAKDEQLRHQPSQSTLPSRIGQFGHQPSQPTLPLAGEELKRQPSTTTISTNNTHLQERPHSDPITTISTPSATIASAPRPSTCPWPATFFATPRAAPPVPPPKSPERAIATDNATVTAAATRAGSVAAARKGIEERMQRDRMQDWRAKVPSERVEVERAWSPPVSVGEDDGAGLVVSDEEGMTWREV